MWTILEKMGLTKKESEIYVYLAQSQHPRNGTDISNTLRIHKGEAYRTLKNLEAKGLVESTLDRPIIYSAISFEKVLDLYIATMREKALSLESEKEAIVAESRLEYSEQPTMDHERFQILRGRDIVFAKMLQMGLGAKNEILSLWTSTDELKYHEGLLPAGTRVRSLIPLPQEGIDIRKIKRFQAIVARDGVVGEARYFKLKKKMTYNVLVQDDSCAMLTWRESGGDDLVAFWTNGEVFVDVWREFFEKLWAGATNLNGRPRQAE